MRENFTLIKYVDFLLGLSNFYCIEVSNYYLKFQGDFNKPLIQALLSFGASFKRDRYIITLKWSGCRFVFSI